MKNYIIENISFKKDSINESLTNYKYGQNWPVIYLLSNNKEIYIGETLNLFSRLQQHLKNESKLSLKQVYYVTDDTFNKSVTLDFENRLISYLSALGKFGIKLINNNAGQSHEHDYFDRTRYDKLFPEIWNKLMDIGLVNKTLKEIDNYNEFKYSPFKSLKNEQYTILNEIISTINSLKKDEKFTFFIEGGAGTGKSLIAIKLAKIFSQYQRLSGIDNDYDGSDNDQLINEVKILSSSPINFGLVIPLQSFRKTIKKVFNNLKNGLSEKQVISPYSDLFNNDYEIIIVDEAHRLKSGKYLSQEQGQFKKLNKKYYNGSKKNQLDWIIDRSRIQIIFYDQSQSVRSSDLSESEFTKLKSGKNVRVFDLKTQFRVKAGNDFINYIDKVFSSEPPKNKLDFSGYDLRIFDDIKMFKDEIIKKNNEFGLSRIIAGYSWKWTTKKEKNSSFDFEINGLPFTWNRKWHDWINYEGSINEVGCIHTTQGYDLNYVGVIVGKDLTLTNDVLDVNLNNFYDNGSIKGLKSDVISKKNFVLNAYKTMFKRGINGLYLYIVDDRVKEYLKKYF